MRSSSVLNAEHHAQTGFEFVQFAQKTSIVFSDNRFIRHIEPDVHPTSVTSLNVGGLITAMQTSPDYSYLALCADDDRCTRMIVFDTDTYQVSAEFDMDIIASEMRISATNEIIWTVQYNARLFTLIRYALLEGKVIASGKVNVEMPAAWWQGFVSEQRKMDSTDAPHALRLLTDLCCDYASNLRRHCFYSSYLMGLKFDHISNTLNVDGTIIDLFDVRCQDWSNDVTLAFGASACQIMLYRETSPIKVVDLRHLSNQEVLMALPL
uniref:Uncharacterized protein n=1 Tax=Parascaris equorum TaxID=6256 RepID=A0A914RLC2_PAREQ